MAGGGGDALSAGDGSAGGVGVDAAAGSGVGVGVGFGVGFGVGVGFGFGLGSGFGGGSTTGIPAWIGARITQRWYHSDGPRVGDTELRLKPGVYGSSYGLSVSR